MNLSFDEIALSYKELFIKTVDNSKKLKEIYDNPINTSISETPYQIVYTEDRVRLKYYKLPKGVKKKIKTPLLITYALINRETMLDLEPKRSIVKNFLNKGIELYIIDWGYPTKKDKYLTIEDHICGYMDNIVNYIRIRENVPKINLMGICMGGTFSIIYSSIFTKKIKNLITTVTPTNFNTSQGLLHLWMKGMNIDTLVSSYGNIPGDLMNLGFLLLNPAKLVLDKYKNFVNNIDNKRFVENFVRMEKWIFDSPDVPGETFRQFIKDLYQNNLLIKNKMVIGDNKINLKRIDIPLLNFYGEYDHLVPPEACNKITSAVGSKDVEDVGLKTGHIGIYVSSKYQNVFVPKIIEWLKSRDINIKV